MSSISAGTSSGTALVQSGDTTGALVIKTGGSAATAATFNADQTTTLAQPLPVASGGTGATSLSGITVGTATSATTATTATNLSGGSGGTIPYQTSSGATSMLAAGTSGYLLQSNGTSAPSWVAPTAPAGSVTAVASGALSDGSMVILNSDGTVSTISGTIGTSITQLGSASVGVSAVNVASGSYDSSANSIFVAYRGPSGYLYGVAGSISGNNITFGTPTVIESGVIGGSQYLGPFVQYCSQQNCHAILYCSTAYGITAVSYASVTVSSASFSIKQNNPGSFDYGNAKYAMTYDTTNGRLFIMYYNQNSGNTMGYIGTVNSSTKNISFSGGQAIDTSGSNSSSYASLCYDAISGKVVAAYLDAANNPYARVITINSGTSFSMGTATYFAGYGENMPIALGAYYSGNKVVVGLNYSGTLWVGVGTISGTSISFGSFVASGLSSSSNNSFWTPFSFTGAATFMTANGYIQKVVVSGTTASFPDSAISFGSAYYGCYFVNGSSQIVNTSSYNPTIYAYIGDIVSTNLTSTNFLGISNAAYTNGQTATIQTVGSTDDAQSGLTAGLKYYVTGFGTISSSATTQPYAGLALSATKLVIKG